MKEETKRAELTGKVEDILEYVPDNDKTVH